MLGSSVSSAFGVRVDEIGDSDFEGGVVGELTW